VRSSGFCVCLALLSARFLRLERHLVLRVIQCWLNRCVDSLDGTSFSVMSEQKFLRSFHSVLTSVSVVCFDR